MEKQIGDVCNAIRSRTEKLIWFDMWKLFMWKLWVFLVINVEKHSKPEKA